MVRTQIQFTESQLTGLRALSRATGRSIAELTRDAVEDYLERMGETDRSELIERALSVAGRFASGLRDISSEHDRYFAETLGE